MKYEKQLEAKKLRLEGIAIELIAKQLGVSKGSVTELAQQLFGAIQEYGNFDNGMYLDNKLTRKKNN